MRSYSKSISFAVAFLFVVCAFAIIPFESEAATPTVAIEKRTAETDDNVEIDVNLEDNPGIASIQIVISFPSALKLKEVKDEGLINLTPGTISGTSYTIYGESDSDVTKSGTIATFIFETPDAEEGTVYKINVDTVKAYNSSFNTVSFTSINGSITIEESSGGSGLCSFTILGAASIIAAITALSIFAVFRP